MSFPFLSGNNIELRPLEESDADGNYSCWFNDAEVCFGNSHHTYPYTYADARDFISSLSSKKDMLILAVVNKVTGVHIGNISLQEINYIYRSAELAIIIGEKMDWGKGFGKEAVRLMLSHGFNDLNLNRISCGTFENNIAMQKIALSFGMKHEGTRRMAVFKNGKYLDLLEYGILRNEFEIAVKANAV
jgi:RimJ/RimL family protein N-acetyltransferase